MMRLMGQIGARDDREGMRYLGHARRLFIVPHLSLFLLALLFALAGIVLGMGIENNTFALGRGATSSPNGASPSSKCLIVGTPTPTPKCGLAWRVVTSPNPGPLQSELFSMTVVSHDDIWAVGAYNENSTSPARTLTLHWDGVQWSHIPSPNADGGPNLLIGVAAAANNDVWAVGYYDDPAPGNNTLVLRWNGTAWSIMPSPNAGTGTNVLRRAAVVSPNDVWAVGYYGRPGTQVAQGTLVEHWDGTQWSVVPSPNVNNERNELWDVSVVSANDIWAVGTFREESGGESTLSMHWDGTQWSIVPSPNFPQAGQNIFRGVSAVASDYVWAVGNVGGGYAFASLTEHWDGTQWNVVPSPRVGTNGPDYPAAVSALSANDVWIVGYYLDSVAGRTLVLHWDGQEWRHIPSPSPGGLANHLEDVEAITPTDVWAVGYMRLCGMCPWQTLTLRYSDPCPASSPSPTPSPTATPTASPTITYTTTPLPLPSSTRSDTATPPRATVTPTFTAEPATETPTSCPLPFTDVFPTDYFYEAVRHLYCAGVISGYSDGTFRPYNPTTRGQLTKIVVLGFGVPIYTPPSPTFSDVPTTHTFYQYIETAAYEGLVSGYSDGTFRPENNVTRGQLSKIVVEAAGWPLLNPPTPTFSDVPPLSPFYRHIETAYSHAIISGYADGTFRPGNNATRGQIAKIVYNALK